MIINLHGFCQTLPFYVLCLASVSNLRSNFARLQLLCAEFYDTVVVLLSLLCCTIACKTHTHKIQIAKFI